MQASSDTILLSTAYLPPISWVKAAISAEKVFIEAYETYPKQTYRNRCLVSTANGIIPLSIPIKKNSGQKTRVRDIEIFYDEPWQRMHWRTIHAAYSNSPFYLYYKDDLSSFYEQEHRFLLDFNFAINDLIFKMAGIDISFIPTEGYINDPEGMLDIRNAFSPKNIPQKSQVNTYHQVFEERHGFIADLSIIDLLFNEGPGAMGVLNRE